MSWINDAFERLFRFSSDSLTDPQLSLQFIKMTLIFKIILLCLVVPDSLKAELTLEILVFLPYNIPSLPTSLVLTRPAFDLAVESANEKYFPHLRIRVKYLHNESLVTCDAVSSQSVEKIAEYYYRFRTAGTCYATVMSGTEHLYKPR